MINKRKKVGIISINMYSMHLNYGAAFHSYAFQQYLNKLGVENIIIDYLPPFMSKWNLDFPLLSYVLNLRTELSVRGLANGFLYLIYWFLYSVSGISYRKHKKFNLFFDRYYKKTSNRYLSQDLQEKELDVDIIICESDVIWSPASTKGFDSVYYCDYERMRDKITASYAASIGDLNFTEEEKTEFRRLLTNFDYISVREENSVKFVQRFTDKKVFCVLDPTLLLDAEDYENVIIPMHEKDYLLIYHCMEPNLEMIKTAKKVAKDKHLRVVEVTMFLKEGGHKVYSVAGLGEFLGLYRDASFVVTNGFHGICFAIIFKKDFLAFPRSSKNSRLTSILSILDLSNRLILTSTSLMPQEAINYNLVYDKLNLEREKSKRYINNIINLK